MIKDYENALRLQFTHKYEEARAAFLKILTSNLWDSSVGVLLSGSA